MNSCPRLDTRRESRQAPSVLACPSPTVSLRCSTSHYHYPTTRHPPLRLRRPPPLLPLSPRLPLMTAKPAARAEEAELSAPAEKTLKFLAMWRRPSSATSEAACGLSQDVFGPIFSNKSSFPQHRQRRTRKVCPRREYVALLSRTQSHDKESQIYRISDALQTNIFTPLLR